MINMLVWVPINSLIPFPWSFSLRASASLAEPLVQNWRNPHVLYHGRFHEGLYLHFQSCWSLCHVAGHAQRISRQHIAGPGSWSDRDPRIETYDEARHYIWEAERMFSRGRILQNHTIVHLAFPLEGLVHNDVAGHWIHSQWVHSHRFHNLQIEYGHVLEDQC